MHISEAKLIVWVFKYLEIIEAGQCEGDELAGLPLLETKIDRGAYGLLAAHMVNWNDGAAVRWPQRPSSHATRYDERRAD